MAECPDCGGISPIPYPSSDEITNYYANASDPNPWEIEHYVRKDLQPGALDGEVELAAQLVRLNGTVGRLLEVGCAAGWQLKAARDEGWDVYGVEAAPKFSQFAKDQLGLPIFDGRLEDASVEELGVFDVIVGFDVFEHLYDPAGDLRKLRQLAKPGAHLLLATPNIESVMARFWGLRWRQLVPSHINYPTPEAMRRVLERSGWQVQRISEPRYFDPDRGREARRRTTELLKFIARVVLFVGVVLPSRAIPSLRRLPGLLSGGRISWERFHFAVGDQPVLGDVMMVVAKAA